MMTEFKYSKREGFDTPSHLNAPGAAPLLELSGLTRYFDGILALDAVSINIFESEIFGLIGPNGAGKSTLFDVMTGFCVPDHGHGQLAGQVLPFGAPARCAQLGIARSFQNLRLFRELSALENVMIGADGPLPLNPLRALFGRAARQQNTRSRDTALACLAFVGLSAQSDTRAGALSYGDQRRLEIARALASQPRLLALDEPAAGMNATETLALQSLLEQIRAQGVTIVLIDHDVGLMLRCCDRIAVLDAGRKIAEGTPADIAEHPDVVRAYLGHPASASVDAQP